MTESVPVEQAIRHNDEGASTSTDTNGDLPRIGDNCIHNGEISGPVSQDDTSTEAKPADDVPKLSKNQLKRQQKWEQAMAVKKRRKEQEKLVKKAKAEAQGRDVEAEKRIMEHHRQQGLGWAKREQKWKQFFDTHCSKFQICLDCSFEDQMTPREINSLGSQIRFCYSQNKQAKHPIRATLTSLSGATLTYLQNVSGFDQWENRAFHHTSQDILQAYSDETSKLVYLTSDSDTILEKLEDHKVYIIGGIVDRNRLKGAAFHRAQQLGIATAKLPIVEHLDLVATKVLTVNHVFEILLRLRENENDWKRTLLAVLPGRKDAKEKDP